jgi:hypothetical protein
MSFLNYFKNQIITNASNAAFVLLFILAISLAAASFLAFTMASCSA